MDTDAPRTAKIISGWASEQRLFRSGERQIFTFLIPGDAVVIWAGSDIGNRAVIALTPLVLETECAVVSPIEAVTRISALREQRLLDHVVRLGALNACGRATHLLLELRDRLMAVGLVEENSFRLPVTQEVFGEALGLSVVHVNRTFQQLRSQRLIAYRAGTVTLLKPDALLKICRSTYVQIDEPRTR